MITQLRETVVQDFQITITCSQCGRRGVILHADLEDVLDDDPSIVELTNAWMDRHGWIHDAVFGFTFCSHECAQAHGYDERPDERWLHAVTEASAR